MTPSIHSQDKDLDTLCIFSGQARGLVSSGGFSGDANRENLSPQPGPISATAAIYSTNNDTNPSVDAASSPFASSMVAFGVHPSLEDVVLPEASAYGALDARPEFQNQPVAISPPESSMNLRSAQPLSAIPEQSLTQDSTDPGLFGSTSASPFQQLYTDTLSADLWGVDGMENIFGDNHPNNDQQGLADVDNDWMAFMQENGLI